MHFTFEAAWTTRFLAERIRPADLPIHQQLTGEACLTMITKSERSLRARIAANARWSHTADRSAATAPAREAAWRKFENLVDPDGVLPVHDRALRAEAARRAHFQRMALRSAQVRRARRAS